MMAWDDFRLLLAIARSQGLPGAAERLGVTLSTVFRRLERIESELGETLFIKTRNRYQPTERGQELINAAERMEQETLAVGRKMSGQDQHLTGALRISTSEVLAPFFLGRCLPAFCQMYPGIIPELVSGDTRLSLADREAEVALWPKRPSEGTLVGRKIGDIRWAVYANTDRATDIGTDLQPSLFKGQKFVGYVGSSNADQLMAFQSSILPETLISIRTNSLLTAANLSAAGSGFALLPCLLGSNWPGLNQISIAIRHPIGELWLVCHKDLRSNARVNALFAFLIAVAKSDRAVLEGKNQQQS